MSSFLTLLPEELQTAVTDLGSLGNVLQEANAAASLPTTTILPPALDEVSAAISGVFNAHGAGYQSLAASAQTFHNQFVQNLSSALGSYTNTENAATNMLREAVTRAETQTGLANYLTFGDHGTSSTAIPPSDTHPIILVGGTGYPTIPASIAGRIGYAYFPGQSNLYSLYTPEQFWPLTPQLGSLTLDQSVRVGQQNLNATLMNQLSMGHSATVWGTSQGATVETEEIKYLMAHGSPGTDKLSFVLTGDPNNPDGGAMTRFPNLRVPLAGIHFSGATPPDSPYQTSIYTNQYDGVANFPRYPLNVVSDANALAGFAWGAHDYVDNPYQTTGAVRLATSPGYTGHTAYYETLTQDLPLVSPIRNDMPQPYGHAIADLLQPDLRVVVDMGYGSGEYANIPTPASLIEFPNVPHIAHDLALGTVQGPRQALLDLGLPGGQNEYGHYPYSPVVDPQLNYPVPQSPVTGISLLTNAEGFLLKGPF